MVLLIVIPIAFVLLAFFWRRNVSLYRNNFGTYNGVLNRELVRMYNLFHSAPNFKPLEVSQNFFNFTANLILKTVHFIIFSVVSYIFQNVAIVGFILRSIYALFVFLAWLMYDSRRKFYNAIPADQKSVFTPILKASICIPIYQTAIWILLFFV